uniref:CCHC-type domain-containing protein n=1 Tax=Oryza punctata TaxID=4537 RepID=A0A0E0ML46_ORYPU
MKEVIMQFELGKAFFTNNDLATDGMNAWYFQRQGIQSRMVNTRTGAHDGENENNDARASGQQLPQAPQVNQRNFELFMQAQTELMRMMTQQLQNQQRQQQPQPQGAPPQQSKIDSDTPTGTPTQSVRGQGSQPFIHPCYNCKKSGHLTNNCPHPKNITPVKFNLGNTPIATFFYLLLSLSSSQAGEATSRPRCAALGPALSPLASPAHAAAPTQAGPRHRRHRTILTGTISSGRCTPGGRAILDNIEDQLQLQPWKLAASRKVLREFGNMSGATIAFVLDELCHRREKEEDEPRQAEWGVMLAFGPGITIETIVMRASEAWRCHRPPDDTAMLHLSSLSEHPASLHSQPGLQRYPFLLLAASETPRLPLALVHSFARHIPLLPPINANSADCPLQPVALAASSTPARELHITNKTNIAIATVATISRSQDLLTGEN